LDEGSGKTSHVLDLEGDHQGEEWSNMGTQHIQLWLGWTGEAGRNNSTGGRAAVEL